jgi:hypothetical protein
MKIPKKQKWMWVKETVTNCWRIEVNPTILVIFRVHASLSRVSMSINIIQKPLDKHLLTSDIHTAVVNE